ncbi:acetyl-CoA acyltransferase [Mycobacterium saskatchewanense]|uniref:Acetyl-CoA C-acetyltransferase family protein n=3 Tax=Mycobacterium TaxID=1763 RepID=X8CLE3_MYCIT|nr:acetyl-CoA C-acetyltransferase family protein [Mycobacterium intracellulare]EUA56904.1 acetyl-CoA C-acetyltransferase family protein [Mycobacterium intracellulare 1956]ORW74632.1 acetyl-CoA acetyltransferase [Mycobacterium saskatchewanense]BBX65328.1 acetyl-CoA acyltransferase [Mycobacterium saskatchewanense]
MAVIVDGVRTPSGRGKPGGALSGVHPVDLLSGVLSALIERNNLDPELIDDVITGCVGQAGEQSTNVGRNAVLAAGFPQRVPATTLDRQCGSSQQAAHFAAQGVMAGAYDVVIACGVESMSRIPMFSAQQGANPYGSRFAERYPDGLIPQGVSAELVAAKWGLEREELDEFALRSHQRAAAASASGAFDNEIVTLRATGSDASQAVVRADETVRATTTREGLAQLKPAFANVPEAARYPEIDWKITAGNSSPLTDGASAVLIMSEQKAHQLGLRPRARLCSFTVVGDDPVLMLTAIIPATQMLLERAGIGIDTVDAFEVNEAFASVPLAWQREFGVDPERVNIRGGAIALGHPLGASGTRLLTTLIGVLESTGGRFGLQTMCEGGGMANATLIERL